MLEAVLKDEVVIKIVEKRHARDMMDFVERGRDWFARWIPFVSRTHEVKEIEQIIQRYLDKYAKATGAFYGLWEQGKMIGLVLIRDVDEDAKWAEIGYMIDEEHRGRGLVKAACGMLMRFLFDELGMQKIVICCDDRNENSIALAKSLGFMVEGILRRNAFINGEYCNTMHLGLLREEYGA
jgi:ribosomal-protein-serine acetyltransferase